MYRVNLRKMELFRTKEFYIFVKDNNSLWWDRETGILIPKAAWELTEADDPICLGTCEGIIGRVEHSVFDSKLLIIKEAEYVGSLFQNNIYKIKSVVLVPLGPENVNLNLNICSKHTSLHDKPLTSVSSIFEGPKSFALTKTWGTLRNAGTTLKNTTQQAAAIASGTPKRKDPCRFEKQITEEFYKIFNDTSSFYFCRTYDITNSLQRLCNLKTEVDAVWKSADDHFFWNRHMIKDLVESKNPLCDPWILPVVQGYIQIEDCKVEIQNDIQGVTVSPKYEVFRLCLISRRSRFRAGTRYNRRGVDENGHCANYVETEQVICYQQHHISFVQVRGSVPIYWSQPGYKYRPPPRIDRGDEETKMAFRKHFDEEIKKYGPVCVVNLIEQSGKENVIWEAYTNHIRNYDSNFITYVTFDFHEYCSGMRFENISVLINNIGDIIKNINYCWKDELGHICSQNGVFRVNCIDCLDRTNVVQTAIAKAVMEIQFYKLGLMSPEGRMPESLKSTFQTLWANNGDIISKQYAGTNALKGDYTRTGERKFTGIMKDGVNSANRYLKHHFTDCVRQCCLDIMQGNELDKAELQNCLLVIGGIVDELLISEATVQIPCVALGPDYQLVNALYHLCRYYLSRFKDSTRQGTIDLMLGNSVSEELFKEAKEEPYEEDSTITAEHVKLLIEDCKKLLINSPESVLGSWGVINAVDPLETEMDTILILTRDSYFVADYDDQVDRITKYQRVLLKDLTSLECGVPESGALFFKTYPNRYCVRLNYVVNDVSGYFHMFRSTNLRFFNNMAVLIRSEEEEIESLKAICEAFIVALDICGLPLIPYKLGCKLEKRKSKSVGTNHPSSNVYLDIVGLPHLTRNVSESQLLALKNVGSKALSNMSQQFAKLNRIGSTIKRKQSVKTATRNDVSSDSEGDTDNSIFQSADTFLPGVGIVMRSTSESDTTPNPQNPQIHLQICQDSPFSHKLSHSSGQVDTCDSLEERSNSQIDLPNLSITQSLSESALKYKLSDVTSPVGNVTKVLSPLSKLAKGVQHLGANFDPRKSGRQGGERDLEELRLRWNGCKSKLIAL